uniref:Ribosomal protein S3 n=1 Tax=Mastocarpus papillatus TaxID=31436 RepID=A0A342RZ57_9FLOR|nr:ribosomal protein S3 [Mastocarpus papillatus]AOL58003.1 ribosomal protein S3 [Mastocarpus papillatus]
MAQKINPTSFRLGTTQVWDSTLQNYGKPLNVYSTILHKQLQIQKLLPRYFLLNDFLLNYQEWKIRQNKVLLSIYYSPLTYSQKVQSPKFLKFLPKLLKKSILIEPTIRFYLKLQWSLTPNLIIWYSWHLLDKKTAPKKVILNLCKLLKSYLNFTRVSYFKLGLIETKLIGFKIKLSGKIDSSNQMAKSLEQTLGRLSLTSLSGIVEYSNKEIYTKSGTCGVQVWLFYSIK